MGERCLSLHDGSELFCIEKDTWNGHSDMCQPVYDYDSNRWLIYINRESNEQIGPRIGMYDTSGQPIWTHVDWGIFTKAGLDASERKAGFWPMECALQDNPRMLSAVIIPELQNLSTMP